MPFEFEEILETIKMTEIEHFDIRTVTMGISLRDCVDRNIEVTKQKMYDKILKYGSNHVKYAQEVEKRYGISIANKRISITPLSIPLDAFKWEDFVEVAKTLDKAAAEIGIDYLAGYSALVQKGFTNGELELLKSIPYTLSETKRICSSVNVASTKAGINIDAINLVAEAIKKTAEMTKDQDSIGCAKFVCFANAVEDNPFVAGAFHGISEPEVVLNVGISGPGVVLDAIKAAGSCDMNHLADVIKRTVFKITRAGELLGRKVAEQHGIPFGIVDVSLAPTPAEGDSIGDILMAMGLADIGGPGTTAALALLNDSVKKAGLMASTNVGGMSGAFIPVSEDQGMIRAVENGSLCIEKLEAMTCVCSVGLDMIAVPGDTTAATIAGVIADEAAIGIINDKTTAVRIIPAYGKKVGDSVDYGGLLGKAPIMSVRNINCSTFMGRGGRFPAPTRSLTN
ncbi:MAG: PFL family protein [Bacteroidetes bacterium]|nr:PFL family protein [Bacteroidota bacterium]